MMSTVRGSTHEPIVETNLGPVMGVQRTSVYDDLYYSFEGIPYAKPPLGELRFLASQPHEPWIDGPRDCRAVGNKALQKDQATGKVHGNEDCLYLNVYAKRLHSDKPLPVLVFIHGGAFLTGEGSREMYGPDYFMHQDVVLVLFNYRLCALGFLSLKDPELQVPGNAGLKDQVMALKWIKENISNFNGDADNITLFGNSAGGVSAHYMTLSERTRGLFHKVILMSGCALTCWANISQDDNAYRLACLNGFEGENNDREVLRFLRGLDADCLVKHNVLTDDHRRNDYHSSFGPCVEAYIGEDCVIPQPPTQMLKNAWGNAIPMMLGYTSFEGLIFFPFVKKNPSITAVIRDDPERVLPVLVRESRAEEERKQLAAKVIQTHFGDNELDGKSALEHLNLYSCKIISHPIHRLILARNAFTKAPTFVYRFDFESSINFNIYRRKYCGNDPVRGVCHADDLSYLFYMRDSWKLPHDSIEFKVIERMIGLWTSFAKNSDPNCNEIEPVKWQPLAESNLQTGLNISEEVKMLDLPEAPVFEIWDSLYKSEDLF